MKVPVNHIDRLFRSVFNVLRKGEDVLLDETGTVLTWNGSVSRIFIFTEAQIKNQNFSIFFLPEERQKGLPESLLREAAARNTLSRRCTMARKDGHVFHATLRLNAVRDSRRELLGFELRISAGSPFQRNSA